MFPSGAAAVDVARDDGGTNSTVASVCVSSTPGGDVMPGVCVCVCV